MAIKIGGNTVIDDSRNFININTATVTSFSGNAAGVTGVEVDRIFQPSNVCPADGETCTDYEATFLCGSTFVSTQGKALCCVCFEVSQCEDFSDCNDFTCEIVGPNNSVSATLLENRCYFFRLRYEDEDGCCSAFSNTTTFQSCPDPFADFGCPACGGFYMGTIFTAGSNYYLFMAPSATGVSGQKWKNTRVGTSSPGGCTDGYCTTYTTLNNSQHPAGNWTATRTISGCTDWYLGGCAEIKQLFNNRACAPAGESLGTGEYWTSQNCFGIRFNNGCADNFDNQFNRTVRAIRRVPF